jgi:hypothetical protein
MFSRSASLSFQQACVARRSKLILCSQMFHVDSNHKNSVIPRSVLDPYTRSCIRRVPLLGMCMEIGEMDQHAPSHDEGLVVSDIGRICQIRSLRCAEVIACDIRSLGLEIDVTDMQCRVRRYVSHATSKVRDQQADACYVQYWRLRRFKSHATRRV